MASLKLIHSESVSPDKRGLPRCFMSCRVLLNYSTYKYWKGVTPAAVCVWDGLLFISSTKSQTFFFVCLYIRWRHLQHHSLGISELWQKKFCLLLRCLVARHSAAHRGKGVSHPCFPDLFYPGVNIFSRQRWTFLPARGDNFFQTEVNIFFQ